MSERTVQRVAPEPGDAGPVPTDAASVEGFSSLTRTALVTLIVGVFLPMLSFFVINVALPAIGSDLVATPAQLQLVVATYGIANATLVVVGGRLGDAYGRRRLFLLGLVGFTVFSVLCGFAPSIGTLLLLRIGQGATAALMTPQVLATISATTTGQHRARAVGMFGAAGGIAAAAGQILGGVLVSADLFGLGWRSVFLLNLPLGLVAAVAAWRLIPETKAEKRIPVDAVGALLLATFLVLLLLPLTEGRALGWPLWTWLVLAATVPALLGLALHQRWKETSGGSALVPPSVLRLRPLRIGLLIGVAYFSSFGGFMFVFAVATQGEAGLSALEGGLTLLPLAIAFMAMSVFTPRLQRRWGSGIIVRGWLIQAIGYAGLGGCVLLQWPDISPLSLAVPMLVVGVGSGMVMMPLFGVVLDQVAPSQAGLGSGVLITMQQTCLSLGAATVGTAYLAIAATGWGEGGGLALVGFGIAAVALLAVPLSRRLAR